MSNVTGVPIIGDTHTNAGQQMILEELTQADNHLRNILDRIYETHPLTKRNSAAVRDEVKGMLRHIERTRAWVAESQAEEGVA